MIQTSVGAKVTTARCSKCRAWLVGGACSKGCAQAAPPPVVFSARTDKILGEELDANTRGIVLYDVVSGPSDTAVADAPPPLESAAAPAVVATPVDAAIEKVLAPALTSKEVRRNRVPHIQWDETDG